MSRIATCTAIVIWGLEVLGAAQAADNVAAPMERAKQPTVQELSRAEKVVQEVYGRDMARVKTAADRAKLARDILQAAFLNKAGNSLWQ